MNLELVQKVQDEERPKEGTSNPPTSPITQGVPEPDWMVTWRQSKTFARDSVFLCLIGETGAAGIYDTAEAIILFPS